MVEVGTGVTAGSCDTPGCILHHALASPSLQGLAFGKLDKADTTHTNLEPSLMYCVIWLEIAYKLACNCGDDQYPLSFTIPPSEAVTFSPS